MPSDLLVRKLVLLPGMDGTGTLFAPFIEALPSGFEAVPVSYPNDRPLSNPELKDHILTRLPKNEPFALLAESFSTPLAVQIAASQPAGLRALILVAGFVTNPSYAWLPGLGALLLPGKMRLRLPDIMVRRALLGPAAPRRLLQDVKTAMFAMRPSVFSSRLGMVSSCDSRAELAKVAVPILYLQAKSDRIVKSQSVDEILGIRPDVAVARIEGPHLLLQREPRQSVENVISFIQQLT